MAGHTPGLWHLHETEQEGFSYEVHAEYESGALGKKHHFVAAVGDMHGAERFGNIGTPLDNGNLIIAAPDLLKACLEWAKCKHRPGLCQSCKHYVPDGAVTCGVDAMVEAALAKAKGA